MSKKINSSIKNTFDSLFFKELNDLLLNENLSLEATFKSSRISISEHNSSNTEEYAKLFASLENEENFSMKDILGEGGMGVVYLAQQNIPEREVAIKKVKRQHLTPFLFEEAMILGRLSHPNILPLHQIRLDEKGQLEIVLKKIEGVTFEEILKNKPQKGPELRKALQVLLQICHAVEFLHSQGYLHRDLKPENIMVGRFNQVYLMDLGLAINLNKIDKCKPGLAGTPAYMAPEMLKGNPQLLSPATDVFLLGATLHEILTGERRNPGQNLKKAFLRAQKCLPYAYDEDIPKSLALLCNYACQKEQKNRPQTVAEFREVINDFLDNWEAVPLLKKGLHYFETYKRLWKHERHKRKICKIQLYNYSLPAKFFFEQALDIWPNSKEAKEYLTELSKMMIIQALKEKEYKRAILLFNSYKQGNEDLTAKIERAKKILEQEIQQKKELQAFEREFSHLPIQKSLTKIIHLFVVNCIVMLTTLVILQIRHASPLQMDTLLYAILIVLLPVWTILPFQYSKLTQNILGKRFFNKILFGSFCLVIPHYAFWFMGLSPDYLGTSLCLVLFVNLFNTSSIKNDLRLGLIPLFGALLSFLFLEQSSYIFYLSAIFLGIAILRYFRSVKVKPIHI